MCQKKKKNCQMCQKFKKKVLKMIFRLLLIQLEKISYTDYTFFEFTKIVTLKYYVNEFINVVLVFIFNGEMRD